MVEKKVFVGRRQPLPPYFLKLITNKIYTKVKKNFFLSAVIVFALIGLSSCSLENLPSDEVSPAQLAKNYNGLCIMTDGNYAALKEDMPYKGKSTTSYTFVRRGLEMLAFPADELIIQGRTSSTIFEAYTMERTATLQNVTYIWWCLYKVIMGANAVLEASHEGTSPEMDYLRGENYFLRAFCHLYLCNLYARPYALGKDNPGVVIQLTSGAGNEIKRATVGQCYDQIERDLHKAIELMEKGQRRGNNGYASKEAAQGLLSRVYLYKEEYDKVIKLVNDTMLAGSTYESKLMTKEEFPTFYANTLTAHETLFCVAYTDAEVVELAQSLYAGMLFKDTINGIGWGEAFASDPLLDLYERYPEDMRYSVYINPQVLDASQYEVRFAVASESGRGDRPNVIYAATPVGEEYSFTTESGEHCTTFTEIEHTYPVRYAKVEGQKTRVRVSKKMNKSNCFPEFYISKFSWQNGLAMGASPSFIRWGEVLLNLAEAYAKTSGGENKALDIVNVIRRRAGIREEGMFTTTNMEERGYPTALDVVLEERHLELAFEGFRMIDLVRNKRDIDRQFVGLHTWEVVPYTANKILYPIPFDEISVSGIAQNEGY